MIEPYCSLYGESLDVPELEKQLNISVANKRIRGQIANRGKYKGTPYPDSSCNIEVPKEIAVPAKIEWLANFISENITRIRKLGAKDMTFWIVWRGLQGNMELSATELQKIATLNIPLCMNYYYLSPEDEKEI